MPQNTQMKRQFTTIDGRTVMSNLPQHWGGNDWTITGVDNPLPVGNYVQTESGVWIPQKGSDDGAADVRLTGSNIGYTVAANQVIPAGSTFVSDAVDFKGTRLALGIRFNATTQFEVRLATFAPNTTLAIGPEITVINETTAGRGYGDTKLFSNRGAIVVYNKGQNDITIQRLAITEFMASGNGGADDEIN